MKAPTFDDVMGYGIFTGILGLVIGVLGVIGYATFQSLRSNGEEDYCYVEMWSPGQMAPQYQLHAHRPWRPDRMIGNFPSLNDAVVEADRLKCPVGKR